MTEDGRPRFRAYYEDGSTYDGEPYEAPAFGVLAIVERDADHGRRLVTGKDFYVWDVGGGRWWSVDWIGLVQYLAKPGPKRVLFGVTVDNEVWYAAMRRANDDADFPERTAWGALEERV